MNQGLLPMSQEALSLGEASYYDYTGNVADAEESDKMTRCLGPSNRVLFLRNHGVIVGGDSIEDAIYTAKNLMTAIDIQMKALPVGVDNIHLPSEEARKKAFEQANPPPPEKGSRKWRRGEMEFEAYMRLLDNAGYRTGHLYREPFLRRGDKRDRTNSDVEIPPTATSAGAFYDDDYG
jgi:adducin